MPPRSRTKPATTVRRPRVAGLRQHPAPPAEETTETTEDTPDVRDTVATTAAPTREAPVAEPADAPVAEPTDAPAAEPADAPAAEPEDPTPAEAPATAEAPTATATAPTEAISTPADATTRIDATTRTDATPEAGGEDADGTATARTATPTPAAKPRPTGGASRGSGERRRKGSLTPNPSAATGTAVKERPARSKPAPEPEPGRLSRAASSAGAALGRFGRSRRALPITMVVVIVVCLVLSGLAFWQGRKAWDDGPVSNQAVIDVGGTAEVVGQTREAIEKIFSYDYTRLDDSVDAARTMSTGAFTDQYLSVFDQTIRTPATQQQLRQTATVVNIGVNSIRGDRAEVMALVQFNAQRTSTGESTNAPGLLRLQMDRVDGRWKLAELTPLTAPR